MYKVPKFPVGGLYIHKIQKTLFRTLNFKAQASKSCSLQYSVKSIGWVVNSYKLWQLDSEDDRFTSISNAGNYYHSRRINKDQDLKLQLAIPLLCK